MLHKAYSDFDELFMELNRGFLLNPQEFISYTQNIQGFNNDVILTCKSHHCTLDLATFGYKKGKWPHLLRTYIDWEQLKTFKEKIGKVSGMSYTFYFNQKKQNNGSCLLSVVLTRQKRKGPWTKMNVLWRTSESQRRFAADLVLIHTFINELPQEHCDIQDITFFFNQIYCSGMFINGYLKYFGVDRKTVDKIAKHHPWHKSIMSNYNRFFSSVDQLHSYKALQRMQKLHFGLEEFDPIPIESLSIEKHFNK